MARKTAYIYPILIDPAASFLEVEKVEQEVPEGAVRASRWCTVQRVNLRGQDSTLIQAPDMVHFFGDSAEAVRCTEMAVYDAFGRWRYNCVRGSRNCFDVIPVPQEVNGALPLHASLRFFIHSEKGVALIRMASELRDLIRRAPRSARASALALKMVEALLAVDTPLLIPVARDPGSQVVEKFQEDDHAA